MEVHAELPNGNIGSMSAEQIRVFLMKKDRRIAEDKSGNPKGVAKMLEAHYKTAINHLLGESEDTASGGGNTRHTFEGKALYHESSGVGEEQGLTIFYVKEGKKAVIAGLGYHAGAQTYKFIWKSGDWMAKEKNISLDKKLQKKGETQVKKQQAPAALGGKKNKR